MIIPFLIAIGLNFDTFSVAIVEGSKSAKPTLKKSFVVGLFFGTGQALMTLMGYLLGSGFKFFITSIDHWVAFILLGIIGYKLIKDSNKNEEDNTNNILDIKTLFFLVVATSIDALAVGITFAFLQESIIYSILIIGVITFFVSFVGFHTGKKLKMIFKSKVKVVGGVILIGIGMKILFQHLLLLK